MKTLTAPSLFFTPRLADLTTRLDLALAPARTLLRRLTGQPTHPCSWCIAERGERPHAGDSHGICPAHKARMLAELNGLKKGEGK